MRRERAREKRSIHINTKSAKNPQPKNNTKQMISHLYFPSLFFLAFCKATTTKSHTLNTKKTHNVVIWFFTNLAGLAFLHKKETHNKWFYVFHIFLVFVSVNDRHPFDDRQSVSFYHRGVCVLRSYQLLCFVFIITHWHKFCGDINYINK